MTIVTSERRGGLANVTLGEGWGVKIALLAVTSFDNDTLIALEKLIRNVIKYEIK